MPLYAKDEKKKYELIEPGLHQAVCYAIYDLGMQKQEYKGETFSQHKIMVCFETKTENSKGFRYTLFKKYTLSLNDRSTLCKDLVSLRGKPFTEMEKKGFDVLKLIGVNCQLNIIHNNGYANIGSILPLNKEIERITAKSSKEMPKWIADKYFSGNQLDQEITPEPTKEEMAEEVSDEVVEDDIPF